MRFLATKSQIRVINLGPSIAFRVLPQFSLGVGLDEQYMDSIINQHVAGPDVFGQELGEANFTNEGSNWAMGWHAGVLYEITPATRLGLAYHSRIKHRIEGNSTFDFDLTNVGIPLEVDIPGHFSADVTLPDYANLSFYHDFNPEWAFLASLDYTHWSTIQSLDANYTGEFGKIVPFATIPLDFRNTYRVSGGVNFHPSQRWTLRTGVAYDESPVPNDTARTFRLPDDNRYWVALGAQYIINREFTLDVGYAHIFVERTHIDNVQKFSGGPLSVPVPIIGTIPVSFQFIENAVGDITANVNEVGAQLTWNIDAV
jgi:long-chain fatty acid transport protein